jgi:PEP-CTERM motif
VRFRSGLLAITVVAALLPHRSEAAPIVFTDRATFQSYHALLGLPSLSLETFDAPAWDLNIAADACTMFVPGFFVGHDCHDGGVEYTQYFPDQQPFGFAAFPQDRFAVGAGFDVPQTSIGFDYSVSGVVQFYAGLSFFLSGSGFLGIIDTSSPIGGIGTPHPIPGIASGFLQMDNLLLRVPEPATSQVPEPATSLLLGSGIVLLHAARRRLVKRRRVAKMP